jgi:bacterioferritin
MRRPIAIGASPIRAGVRYAWLTLVMVWWYLHMFDVGVESTLKERIPMQGDPEVLAFLNEQLTGSLTATNQFLLHCKLQEHGGWGRIAADSRTKYQTEVAHIERLADRIIALDGLPNFQLLFHISVGQSITEEFLADRKMCTEAVDRLNRGIAVMNAKGDITSARLFENILEDFSRSVDDFDVQLEMIEMEGEASYLSARTGE